MGRGSEKSVWDVHYKKTRKGPREKVDDFERWNQHGKQGVKRQKVRSSSIGKASVVRKRDPQVSISYKKDLCQEIV